MPIAFYKGQNITKQTLVIDECAFVNCVLKDCDLFYSGGDFELLGTRMENCRIHWRGAAQRTLQLLQVTGTIQPVAPQQPLQVDKSKMN
jgi:hypothetical protein